jgi:nitrite reductase (NADH) small subunit
VRRPPRYVAVGPASALADGQRREYLVDGRPVVVVRLEDELYALNGTCPHQGGPLGRGRLQDGELVCPWHQWRFDPRTGRSCWPEGYTRTARYPVKVEDGQILIDCG